MKKEAAIEELISLPYKKDEKSIDYNPNARLHQIVKLMLFQPSGAMVSCPLAMTDGAAFTLRAIKSDPKAKEYWHSELDEAVENLTSKDPKKHWTSGQWMTEKRGGSDVTRGTDTFAIEEDNKCLLYGYKWFSSATDSDMTLALARFPQTEQELEKGTGKLGLVFLKIRNPQG
jgi:alkylation response protein AidB-like acyl-CoA dehydrogenase